MSEEAIVGCFRIIDQLATPSTVREPHENILYTREERLSASSSSLRRVMSIKTVPRQLLCLSPKKTISKHASNSPGGLPLPYAIPASPFIVSLILCDQRWRWHPSLPEIVSVRCPWPCWTERQNPMKKWNSAQIRTAPYVDRMERAIDTTASIITNGIITKRIKRVSGTISCREENRLHRWCPFTVFNWTKRDRDTVKKYANVRSFL